jgi:hypothetical protein
VEPLAFARGIDAEGAEQAVGRAVQQRNGHRHDPGEPDQRCRQPGADDFGIQEGDGFRDQLAQDDVEDGDDDESDRRGHPVSGDDAERSRQPGEGSADEARQGGLTDPPQAQGGECDAQLSGGDVAVE